jgi:hypothetical protein
MPDETPDRRPIGKLQATRLASLTGIDAGEIAGNSVIDLSDKLRWRIDPELLLFRRVCGRVVKRDPSTGALLGVPFATVHVEDTDCNLIWYSPSGWSWGWFFPFWCRREEIATVVTDECGRFCVNVPRWDIDWILTWRRKWICPPIFIKPSIADLLQGLRPIPDPGPIREWPPVPRPGPTPDPSPTSIRPGVTLRRAEELVGRTLARRLVTLETAAETSGISNLDARSEILEAPKFRQPMPPPMSGDLWANGPEEAQKSLVDRLRIDPKMAEGLDLNQYIGPFWRCFEITVPEWQPIFDVPDITFHVTQDVDGNGDEETIYSESYFDVRWDAGAIPDVTLEASEIAVASVACDTPDVPCADPAIVMAGLIPLQNLPAPAEPYHDLATGYAQRPNKPHPSGLLIEPGVRPLATTPFLGTLQLYGCNHMDGASKYRLRYSFNGGSTVPFVGLSWPLWRWVGSPGTLQLQWPTSDTDGWYPIIPDADGWMPGHLLLNWPTGQDGLYMVDMQLGDGTSPTNVVHTTPPIGIKVDNSTPIAQLAVSWRQLGGSTWTPLGSFCPVVERALGSEVEFKVDLTITAGHLRSAQLVGGGCGGDSPVLKSGIPFSWEAVVSGSETVGLRHWHTGQFDNAASFSAIFGLAAGAPQGAYSFNLAAYSRAFNPAGGDGGFEADWNYDPVYRWSNPTFTFAVVNA